MWQLESQSYAYINGHYFLCVGSETKMDQISFQITRDVENEDPTSWVDQEMLDTIFIFAYKGSLDHVFIEVGPFSYWRFFLRKKIRDCVVNMIDVPFLLMNYCSPR